VRARAPLRGALVVLALAAAALGGFVLQRELTLLPPAHGPAVVDEESGPLAPGAGTP
jgi:hypothetical protein